MRDPGARLLYMVEDAVVIEPVSGYNSLLTGKFTGKFAKSCPRSHSSFRAMQVIQ
jgi:hypothetical protein